MAMDRTDVEAASSDSEASEPATLATLRSEAGDAQARYTMALSLTGSGAKGLASAAQAYTTALLRYCVALEAELDRARASGSSPLPRSVDADRAAVDMEPIVRALNWRHTRARLEARQQLKEMGPAAIGPLLSLIRREARATARRRIVVAGLAIVGLVAGLAGIALSADPNWSAGPAYALSIPILVGSLAFTRASVLQRTSVQILAQFEDVRVIGPLLDSLSIEDRAVRAAASEALTRLLPRVKASDAGFFTSRDMDCLLGALDSSDSDLIVSVLRALEQIGDERFLPKVEQLAELTPHTRAESRARDAAKECIPALLARTEPGRGERVLLRAAAPLADPADTLLRPAPNAGSQSPDVLLRPSDAERTG